MAEGPSWAGDTWVFVVLPDTQNYSESEPAVFDAQTQWIADNAETLNIKLVLQTGDIVQDGGDTDQWDEADEAIDLLDAAEVPYLLACGNHDYDEQAGNADRGAGNYNAYFGQARYTGQSWWSGGFYAASHAENAYYLFSASNRDYIAIILECFPRDEVLTWASGLLTTYASRDAIITTHNQMYWDDTRQTDPGDEYGPDDYSIGGADGDDVWAALQGHDNILLIVSSHQLRQGIGRRIDYSDGGRAVHQHLVNYQDPVYGDYRDGMLRIYTVHPSNASIAVSAYSPTLTKWNHWYGQEFSMDYAALSY